MFSRLARARGAVLATAALAVGVLAGSGASAVSGGQDVPDGGHPFTAKVMFGSLHSCTGALVASRWIVTAKTCFADGTAPVAEGAPSRPTSALVGRTNLAGTSGHRLAVTTVVPHPTRDVLLAELSAPVTDVTPIPWSGTPPTAAETLRVTGYGRTATEWTPDRLHTATFTVDAVGAATVDVAGTSAAATVCKGDAGGPAFRETGTGPELVAINNLSWQHGCLGETETRTGVTQTRLDDLGDWFRQTLHLQPYALSNTVVGEFTRDGRDDLIAAEPGTGKLWLHPGTSTDRVWGERVQIEPETDWSGYRDLVAGQFDGDAYDDLLGVEVSTNTLWLFPGTAGGGGFADRVVAGTNWQDLADLVVGRFNRDAYEDLAGIQLSTGKLLMFPGTSAGGSLWGTLTEIGFSGWTGKRELVAGRFNRDGYDDLVVVDKSSGDIQMYAGTATGGSTWGQVSTIQTGGKGLTALAAGKLNPDGYDDLVAVESDQVWLYPGTAAGGSLGARVQPVGRVPVLQPHGLLESVTGEFNRDAYADLIGVEKGTGRLWLYPGTAAGTWGPRIAVGSGWNGYRDLTVGRFNRDDYDDLLAMELSTGNLWLYPGTAAGTFWGSRGTTPVGFNWLGLERLTAGRFNGDAYDDVVAVEKTTGKLRLYPGTAAGSGWGASSIIDSGDWNALGAVVRGRFNRDAYDDLMAVEKATGKLWLYPGTAAGGSFGSRVEVFGGGWAGRNELAALRFDQDGHDDLVAGDAATGQVWVYPGTPTGGAVWGDPTEYGPIS
ncbi:FG-GAP-like repeat-containing protein [Micromonospora sp. WMMD964]|uniref:FG-GAP-like repeat-containing protein n=1 Tax=Micromonospora sp. WMMD964 TaxID=3016091 RepID=UPI00249CE9FD|nr:FG-GAP-like repeat-containing protein [Micromonospora sp. WMMD964]WFE98737.1 trypsin-like serine protease [Micromonospora sp. WMMD964]